MPGEWMVTENRLLQSEISFLAGGRAYPHGDTAFAPSTLPRPGALTVLYRTGHPVPPAPVRAENSRCFRQPAGVAPSACPPVQAEVWVDVNGDGQFSSDAAAGERLAMEAHGDDYAAGVLFTVQRPPDRSYAFRFADEAWNPPEPGGLVPGVTQGISYGLWAVRNRPEGGEGPLAHLASCR
jgi:hypothetical protein